ncbi:hypothetical protein [Spiroplasma endosymbiont of Polydrusus formosus]|uniref:hypothetical protein n=1 Tax=Spiroplasma endosymbiont of Polydrusus formosus TaxID=3139326 RepID=UPI0035B52B32
MTLVNQKKAIMQAVRDYKKLILITSTNPNSIYQNHIDYLNKLLSFNRKKLENKS